MFEDSEGMKWKSRPLDFDLMENLSDIIKYSLRTSELSKLYRQGYLNENRGRKVPFEECESIAEHTLEMAKLGHYIVNNYRSDLDLLKVLELCLYHDSHEFHSGDHPPIGDQTLKLEKENIGRHMFVEGMNNSEDMMSIMLEYEEQKTPESQFVKELDKFQMSLKAALYCIQGYISKEDGFFAQEKYLSDPTLLKANDDLLSLIHKA